MVNNKQGDKWVMYKLKWRVAKVQKVFYFINEERAEPMNLRGDEFPVLCSSELMGQKNPVKWEEKNVHRTEVTFSREKNLLGSFPAFYTSSSWLLMFSVFFFFCILQVIKN